MLAPRIHFSCSFDSNNDTQGDFIQYPALGNQLLSRSLEDTHDVHGVWSNSMWFGVADTLHLSSDVLQGMSNSGAEILRYVNSASFLLLVNLLCSSTSSSIPHHSSKTDGSASEQIENQTTQSPIDVLESSMAEDPSVAEASSQSSGSHSSTAATAIGTILMNGKSKCNQETCSSKTFSRPAELKRHFATTHASKKPAFWCHILTCDRSAALGIKSFSRKDKLAEHIRKSHEGVDGY